MFLPSPARELCGRSPSTTVAITNPLVLCDSPELMAALLTRGGDPNVTNQVDQPPNRPVVCLIPRANLMR